MGRRFGKKNKVSLHWYDYNLGLIGESGVGKTSIAYEICSEFLGEDGYILLNIGLEDGVDALPNVIYEDVEDWSKFTDIIDDIIENKNEHYPNLKLIVFDTMDELIKLSQDDVIKRHNRQNPNKRINTIRAAFGGFMAGEDMAIAQILDKIWKLKEVGVNPFVIAHTKNRTKTDVITGEEYDILTSKMTNRNFDEIKTKLDILGTAYIDRSITKTSESNIIGETVVKGKVDEEKRVIAFRDNNYSVECKSRFANIVNKIDFDARAFVEAIENAIKESHSRQDGAKSLAEDKKAQKLEKELLVEKKIGTENVNKSKQEILDLFTENFKTADADTKAKVVDVFKKHSITVAELKDVDNTDEVVYNDLYEVIK